MKQGLLNTLTPFAVTLYKSFQQKHPLVALGIGGTIMIVWGGLTAVTQSGILAGTSLESHTGAIANTLSFLGMGVNLLLSASNATASQDFTAKVEPVLESKETTITETQTGSIQDLLNKKKKN